MLHFHLDQNLMYLNHYNDLDQTIIEKEGVELSTIDDKLNYLVENSGGRSIKKVLLANYNDQFGIAQGEKEWTYDATGLDNYQNLTADNFVLDDFIFRAASHNTNDAKNNTTQIKTYDAINGILKFSTMRTGQGWSMGGICSCNLYLYYI